MAVSPSRPALCLRAATLGVANGGVMCFLNHLRAMPHHFPVPPPARKVLPHGQVSEPMVKGCVLPTPALKCSISPPVRPLSITDVGRATPLRPGRALLTGPRLRYRWDMLPMARGKFDERYVSRSQWRPAVRDPTGREELLGRGSTLSNEDGFMSQSAPSVCRRDHACVYCH